jgi:hypothetical protein
MSSMTNPMVGIGAMPHYTQTPSGEWRVEMEPLDPRAKEWLPDQPILGFGATKDEAKAEGMGAFSRSLAKLTDEQRKQLMTTPVEEDAKLIAATGEEASIITDPDEVARIAREGKCQ